MDTKKIKEAARESSRLAGYVPGISADQVGRANYECGFLDGAKWRELEQEIYTDANNISHKYEAPAWAARDRGGELYIYLANKPIKDEVCGKWLFGGVNGGLVALDPDMFPQVKWEDYTPTSIVMITTTEYRIKED